MFYTDGTESEPELDNSSSSVPKCTCPHDGKLLVDDIFSVHIDELFTMLFTNSQFFLDLQEIRKSSNVKASNWFDETDGYKKRIITMTVPLTQTIGPKATNVTETQTMLPCSEPGLLYSIDVKIDNKGIPYADRFYLTAHFCILKCSDQKTSLEIYADVKYTQKVWGFVKNIIDKNSWQGLADVYTALKEELYNAIDDGNKFHKKKIRQRKRTRGSTNRRLEDANKPSDFYVREKIEKFQMDLSLFIITGLLFTLVVINIYLFYKLWSLETAFMEDFVPSSEVRNKISDIHDNFITRVLQQQAKPNEGIDKWLEMITKTIQFLRSAEESLQNTIPPK